MSNTNNVRLGPCRVFFGGVDLGYTQGGVEFEVKTETHPVKVDQFGMSMINELIIGRTCSVKAPLAETTLDNLVRVMPGATLLQIGGTLASATVTFTAASTPVTDTVTINGVTLAAATVPANSTQWLVGTTASNQAAAFAAAVNNVDDVAQMVTATALAGVVTLTANGYDSAFFSYNTMTLAKTGTNNVVSGALFTGGVVPTKEVGQVPTGVGQSLLAIAQVLVLHPQANADTDRHEDIVIPLAATSGGMKFSYAIDKERVFDVTFAAYPNSITGMLFMIGDPTA